MGPYTGSAVKLLAAAFGCVVLDILGLFIHRRPVVGIILVRRGIGVASILWSGALLFLDHIIVILCAGCWFIFERVELLLLRLLVVRAVLVGSTSAQGKRQESST